MGDACGAAKLANSKGRKLNFVDRWGRSMTHCKHFAMKRLHRLSLSEQTAAHLRDGLREGRWRGQLPGEVALAAEPPRRVETLG